MKRSAPSIRFIRSMTFSAAHRYANLGWSKEQNRDAYGTLAQSAGFGHNFVFEAHLEGPIDPLSGMIVNLVDVDRVMNGLKKILDHQYLNDLAEFGGRVPTPEVIATFAFEKLRVDFASLNEKPRLVKVRLYEGENFWVDVEA